MKITLIAADLSSATSWAAKLVGNKPIIPVLAGVLLSEHAGQLRLSASDTETFVDVTVAATISEPGRAVVSAALLANVAKTLPATAEVSIASASRGLTLRCGRYSAGLPELDAADWPPFPAIGEQIGTADGAALTRCLSRVLPVVDPGHNTVQLTGVLLDLQSATLVAADGKREATAELPWQPVLAAAGEPEPEPLIIPASLLRFGLEAANGGSVAVHTDGNTVSLVTARHRITGRLIAGKFPGDWQALMDAPVARCQSVVTAGVDALRQTIEQVSAAEGPRDAKVPTLIRLEISQDEIGIALASVKDSSADTAIETYSLTGELVTVGMTADYLLDALRCLGSPMVTMTFQLPKNGKPQGFLLCAADERGMPIDDGYRHLIMPRILQEPA